MPSEHVELLALLEEWERREASRLFPDTGPLRRELYPKQMEFFRLGAHKRIRAFMAANRVGKTLAGCYELRLHLTGLYPDWWEGKRFDRPIVAWCASDTGETTRDGLQRKLFGPMNDIGSGIIPSHTIGQIKTTANTNGAIDFAMVKHVSGGWSEVKFKAYADTRAKFQASDIDVVMLDEEPRDAGIYTECVTRTATTNGIVMLTFTALRGITPLVMMFRPDLGKPDDRQTDDGSSRAMVTCGWDEVPHLSEEAKRELKAEYKSRPHEMQARTTGIPSIGAGAIYPIPETEFVIKPFDIPRHWPRVYALDPGWDRTAAVWGALDRESDTVYLYSEYYRGQAEPEVHARALRARGPWIPGVSDNAFDVKNGVGIIDIYKSLGLLLRPAQKSDKEARMVDVHSRLSTGRMKVFSTLENWLYEFRMYQRDEKGRIASPHDHLMNATEYLCQSGLPIARVNSERKDAPTMREMTFGLA
jgi:phage terminase large subunit-like protein